MNVKVFPSNDGYTNEVYHMLYMEAKTINSSDLLRALREDKCVHILYLNSIYSGVNH